MSINKEQTRIFDKEQADSGRFNVAFLVVRKVGGSTLNDG